MSVYNVQVFDKEAFSKARKQSRGARDRSRRHSSLEPTEVEHVDVETVMYALVNKTPPKKSAGNKEVTSLLSSTVRAQLPPEATDQINKWEVKEEKKATRGQGYVQLDFHTENGVMKGRIADEKKTPDGSPFDAGKTKFGYSTVVFEKETSASNAEAENRRRPKKLPPLPPPKYDGSGSSLKKNASDSQILYSDVDFTPSLSSQKSKNGGSLPDQRHSEAASTSSKDDGDESPYVNVRHNKIISNGAPPVPPRRGVASPMVEENPTVPLRRAH